MLDTMEKWGAPELLDRKQKHRKRLALLARRNRSTGRFVPVQISPVFEVFETSSGLLAYRHETPDAVVSLPWVSILGVSR